MLDKFVNCKICYKVSSKVKTQLTGICEQRVKIKLSNELTFLDFELKDLVQWEDASYNLRKMSKIIDLRREEGN